MQELSLPNLGRLEGLWWGHLSLYLSVLCRYHQVLHCCSLNRDLEILPFGDMTEVSARRGSLVSIVMVPCNGLLGSSGCFPRWVEGRLWLFPQSSPWLPQNLPHPGRKRAHLTVKAGKEPTLPHKDGGLTSNSSFWSKSSGEPVKMRNLLSIPMSPLSQVPPCPLWPA